MYPGVVEVDKCLVLLYIELFFKMATFKNTDIYEQKDMVTFWSFKESKK